MKFHAFLDDALGSPVKVRLLRLLVTRPSRQLTGREIATELRLAAWYTGKLLKQFERSGLLARRVAGKSHLWSVNTDHALFDELQRLFLAEKRAPEELASFLKRRLAKRPILRLSLFGSIARGQESEQSDIDVLVVCEDGKKQAALALVDACAARAAARYGNALSPLLYERSEFARKRATPLLKRILAEEVLVHG